MIDKDVIEPARKLAAHGLRALDNAGTLRVPAKRELATADNGAKLRAQRSSEPYSLVDRKGYARAQVGLGGLADGLPASRVQPGQIILRPFEIKHGLRRRDCVALLNNDRSFLAMFALWDAFASLFENLGPDNAAAVITKLPADRLIGLSRAFVRGNLDRADWTLRLTEAGGSGRAWSEILASTVPLTSWRITEKVATHA